MQQQEAQQYYQLPLFGWQQLPLPKAQQREAQQDFQQPVFGWQQLPLLKVQQREAQQYFQQQGQLQALRNRPLVQQRDQPHPKQLELKLKPPVHLLLSHLRP